MTPEQRAEAVSQRHDFITEYYKMATVDLDRHLKGGWQTIVVLAGGAAALTAGHAGDVPLPYASAIALVAAIWGALSVVDANYWSIRAIAFLSNVEAVYLSVEDRKSVNPYVGYHPKYKLMDSLRYLFALCSALSVIIALSVVIPSVVDAGGARNLIRGALDAKQTVLPWVLPTSIFLWGWAWILQSFAQRARDYEEFVSTSPGPGVRLKTSEPRDVFGQPFDQKFSGLETGTHERTLLLLQKSIKRWSFAYGVVVGVSLVVTGVMVCISLG